MSAPSARPTRRLASLPARIVLLVCAATLATSALVGLPAVEANQRALAAHLADSSAEVLGAGGQPSGDAGAAALSWEVAHMDAAGDVRPGPTAGHAWDLPPDWPSAPAA